MYQIDVAVNAPEAGTIKEFLAQEEDTVTVGQDLVRLEIGGAPSQPKEPAAAEPKEPSTPSEAKPAQKDEPSPPKEEKKVSPPQEQPKETPPPKKPEPKAGEAKATPVPTVGSREERRVCDIDI